MGRRLVLFPLPLQGHVTPMLNLATLLHSKGFSITIIHTRYNSPNPNRFPHFTFYFLDDGLSENSIPSSIDVTTILSALNTNCLEPFRCCISQILSVAEADTDRERVACLITDAIWSFAGSVTNSFNLPRIVLSTSAMSAYVVNDSLPVLREKGYFPLQEAKLDEAVPELPPLRVRDLPTEEYHDLLSSITKQFKTSHGVICNTFEELEESSIARVRNLLPIPIFPIGPMHKLSPPSEQTQDQASISWLNTQSPNSVLYVSFGSIASINKAEFLEIAWGLANSKQPFLWVVRPGLSQGSDTNALLPEGYLEIVSGRAHIMTWAPQLEVLSHPSVGGFWTHCGWNSTLESICQGVPMICMPSFADQPMNARLVSEDWKIGLQLENGMKRDDIEKAIQKLWVEDEMRSRVTTLKEKANLCLMESGSSYNYLERLISYLLSF